MNRTSFAGKTFKKRPRHENGRMNKLEQKYALYLTELQRKNDIIWWEFEGVSLRLADRTTYTPDFQIQHPDGEIVMIEIKAYWKSKDGPHWEDDARIKWKAAAKLYPFKMIASWLMPDGTWAEEEAKYE